MFAKNHESYEAYSNLQHLIYHPNTWLMAHFTCADFLSVFVLSLTAL